MRGLKPGLFKSGGWLDDVPKAQFGLSSLIPSYTNFLSQYINPFNWGVKDYTDKGDFNKAFESAKKDGKDEFMWKGRRFNTRKDTDPLKYEGNHPKQKEWDAKLKKEYPEFYKVLNRGSNVGKIKFEGLSKKEPNRAFIEKYATNSQVSVGENPKDFNKFLGNIIAEAGHLKDPTLGSENWYNIFDPSRWKNAISRTLYGEDTYYDKGSPEYNAHRLYEPGMAMVASANLSPSEIKRIQKHLGVKETGHFGADTYKALEEKYRNNERVKKSLETSQLYNNDYDKYPMHMGQFKDTYYNLPGTYMQALSSDVPIKSLPYTNYTDQALLNTNIDDMNVESLQYTLQDRGYQLPKSFDRLGFADGVLGPETIAAYQDWLKKNKKAYGGSLTKAQFGIFNKPVSSRDSVQNIASNILKYEQLRGGPGGIPLPSYSDPKYMEMLMDDIYPEVKKIMPNASAMETGEAMDFIFNAGWDKANKKIKKDPRAFALQEYYKKYDPSQLDSDKKWAGRKNAPYSYDDLYANTIAKLPENERRILMNKGRDWYYQNINNPSPGVLSPDYKSTWYGRIWNTNDYAPFNPNNPKFTPKKAYGGDPSLPGITGHYPFGGQYTKTHTHFKTGGWLDLPVAQTGLQNELNPDADPRFKLVRPEDKKANEVVFDVDPFTGKAGQRDYVNLDEISVSPKTEIEEKDKEWRANAAKYSMEDWFNKYMPNIGLARAMGVNPNNLSDQQKQEYRRFIDTKTAEDIMRRKPLQGQSELDYANWFKNLTQGEQDLISRTPYAGRGMLDTPAKFQGIDFAKAQAANRMLESVNAEKEDLFGNPNWRDVLRRRTQATGDKLSLRRIPGIGEYIPEILDVTGDIGRMASALGASPAEAQEQNSIMPYITSVGNPILQGTVGKFLNPKASNLQFLNEMVNPLAGLTEYGVNKAAGLGKKLKGSKVASGVAGFKPVDLSSISGTISEPVPMASLKGNTPPLSPAQALEKRFEELNKLNLENRNVTDNSKFKNELKKLKRDKTVYSVGDEELKEILRDNPNINIDEQYINSKNISDLAEEQDKLFDEGNQFNKQWMYKDVDKTNEILNELELNNGIKISQEHEDRINQLTKELDGLDYTNWTSPKNDVQRAKDIFAEINAIHDPYYQAHSNRVQELENELYNNVRPEFVERLKNVHQLQNPLITDSELRNIVLSGARDMRRVKDPVLIRFGEGATDDAFKTKLTDYDREYLSKSAPRIGGAKTAYNTITLGESVNSPNFRLVKEPYSIKQPGRKLEDILFDPVNFIRGYHEILNPNYNKDYLLKSILLEPLTAMEVGRTGVHEGAHDFQTAFGFSPILGRDNPKYNYYTNEGTPFGDKFGEHLVDPVPVPANTRHDYDTWLSSGNELHSETQSARFAAFKSLMERKGLSAKEAMDALQNPNDEMLDWLLKYGNLEKHFIPGAPKQVKREILRKYMPAIGGVGLGIYGIDQAIDQGQEPTLSNKYGGTPRKLSKKSTSKNIKSSINKIMARNTTLYGDSGKAYYEPNVKPYYKSGGWLDKLPVAQYGKVKGNPVSDWWYNTEDVQNTYKMAPDVDPFLKDWLLHPETQRRLKENLSSSVLTRDINPNNLTKTAIKRLYSLPMFSRELVRNKGVTASDIEYNNELQGWKTPSTILGNPYYSGDPNELGVYMPDYHVSMVNSFNQPGVVTHEQTHATGPFQDAMEDVIRSKFFDKKDPDKRFVKEWGTGLTNYDLKKGVKEPTYEEVKNKYPGIYKEWQSTEEYLDRDGMYPRIMDIRRTLKLKPGQKVNKSILDNKSIANPLLDLRHYYDDDTIINMLNTLAKTQSIEKPTTAKYGGWLDDN